MLHLTSGGRGTTVSCWGHHLLWQTNTKNYISRSHVTSCQVFVMWLFLCGFVCQITSCCIYNWWWCLDEHRNVLFYIVFSPVFLIINSFKDLYYLDVWEMNLQRLRPCPHGDDFSCKRERFLSFRRFGHTEPRSGSPNTLLFETGSQGEQIWERLRFISVFTTYTHLSWNDDDIAQHFP